MLIKMHKNCTGTVIFKELPVPVPSLQVTIPGNGFTVNIDADPDPTKFELDANNIFILSRIIKETKRDNQI